MEFETYSCGKDESGNTLKGEERALMIGDEGGRGIGYGGVL